MIVHFKRHQNIYGTDIDFNGPNEGLFAEKLDIRLVKRLLLARFFLKSWSFDLALGGVVSVRFF